MGRRGYPVSAVALGLLLIAVTQLTQLSNQLYPEFIEAVRTETGIDPEYQASGMLVLTEQSSEPEAGTAGCPNTA